MRTVDIYDKLTTKQELVLCRNILKLGRKMLHRIKSLMIIFLSVYLASLFYTIIVALPFFCEIIGQTPVIFVIIIFTWSSIE